MVFWKEDQLVAVPFKCNCWRCDFCCRRIAARDYTRIRNALDRARPAWTYLVLTYNQRRVQGPFAAYRTIYPYWKRLTTRIRRHWGRMAYIMVVEQHRSSWPHVNLLLHCERLAAAAEEDFRSPRKWLERQAVECGFGFRTWLEPVLGVGQIANYFMKLAGEVGKPTQVPVEAPKGFRRLRASRGVLEAIRGGDGTWGGELVFAPPDRIIISNRRARCAATSAGSQPLPATAF